MKGRHFDECDSDVRDYLGRIVDAYRSELGEHLAGIWLHGSLAFGCFSRALSDIDLLIAVSAAPPEENLRKLAADCVALTDRRPIVGDQETSVVLTEHLRPFVHPTPHVFQYSESWTETYRAGGWKPTPDAVDPDLAADATVARLRGIPLEGPLAAEIIGPVRWEDFLSSVTLDYDWIVDEGHLLTHPLYGILNLCRHMHLLTRGPGTAAGKEEAARWALQVIPQEQRVVVRQALAAYVETEYVRRVEKLTAGLDWDAASLESFRDYAVHEVARLRDAAD